MKKIFKLFVFLLHFYVGDSQSQLRAPSTSAPQNLMKADMSNATGALAIASGGTGSSSAANARIALLPSKTGNALKYLRVNAAETDFEYNSPSGAGTVTDMSIVTANGISGSVATSTSTPAVTLTLGAITPTTVNGNTFTTGTYTLTGAASKTFTFNNTLTLSGTDGTTITMPSVSSTLLPNTTTSGVAASATASGTQTVTHNLGRTPIAIRIYSISSFTSNAAATPVPFSMGTWNSTGNRCVYMVINGTTTQVSQTSSTFAIIMVTSAGNRIEGVIQNVTSTGFDIVWTETGTHTAGNFLWEAQ